MLRKLLLVLVALLLLWGGFVLLGNTAERKQLTRPWPAGLGPVESVPRRYPDRGLNVSALRLVTISRAAGVDIAPGARQQGETPQPMKDLFDYVRRELTRAGVAPVSAPPPGVAALLAQRGPALTRIQEHLLAAPIAEWPQKLSAGADAPVPHLAGFMHLSRLLIASAMQNRDWNALHAAWKLEQQLHSRPELISQLVGIAIVRMINGTARMLPLPEPAWMNELRARDYNRAVIESLQAEAWITRQIYANADSPGPYVRLSWANLNESYVDALGELAVSPSCAITGEDLGQRIVAGLGWWNVMGKVAVPSLGGTFQRIARLRVEIEGTEKLALAKQGRFDPKSRCGDGAWALQNGVLRFTKPLPPPQPADFAIPIEMPVPAQQQST